MEIDHRIGTNINLKLRLQRDEARKELEKAKIQRDIAIKKNDKLANVIVDLRKLIEHGKEKK